jgi:Rab proteins geranylgeranyltransferase component A
MHNNLQVNLTCRFMVYLSTLCADASTGKQFIKKAVDALFTPQAPDSLEGHLETTSENNEDLKPTVIWSCVYVQEITEVNFVYHHYRMHSCSLSTHLVQVYMHFL